MVLCLFLKILVLLYVLAEACLLNTAKSFLLAPGQSFNVPVNPWLVESGRRHLGEDMGCYGMKTNVFKVSPEFIDVCCRAVIFHKWGYGLANTLLHACVISALPQEDQGLVET